MIAWFKQIALIWESHVSSSRYYRTFCSIPACAILSKLIEKEPDKDGSTCWLLRGHRFPMDSPSALTDIEMSRTTNLSPLLAAIFLLITIDVVESNECCKEKRVGSVSYTLLEHDGLHPHRELPGECLNNCIYTFAGSSSPKFCFQKGFPGFQCYTWLARLCISLIYSKKLWAIFYWLFKGDLPTECLSEEPGVTLRGEKYFP